MKPDKVKIVQIVMSQGGAIYGLGDDSQVYRWITSEAEWAL